ncbi:hypothetical protein GOP47_0019053 [Adiantum capillus-veneris]|uniref:RING-type domain-containing protein n=1 Tax=Adiantum capillus-veneris TaxID=13818 RepID=A0A9D4Z9B6_ADICA|nr:hypothetical protein GOP47_0019053 [Adiantum capillus-veneris]
MGSPLFTLGLKNLAKKKRHHHQCEGPQEAVIFVGGAPASQPPIAPTQALPPTTRTHARSPTTPEGRPQPSTAMQEDGGHPIPLQLSTAQAQGRTIINFRGLLIDVTPSWLNIAATHEGQATEQELQQHPPWLPIVRTGQTSNGFRNYECPICLEILQASDKASSLLPCNHAFHLQCITSWLNLNSSCPVVPQKKCKILRPQVKRARGPSYSRNFSAGIGQGRGGESGKYDDAEEPLFSANYGHGALKGGPFNGVFLGRGGPHNSSSRAPFGGPLKTMMHCVKTSSHQTSTISSWSKWDQKLGKVDAKIDPSLAEMWLVQDESSWSVLPCPAIPQQQRGHERQTKVPKDFIIFPSCSSIPAVFKSACFSIFRKCITLPSCTSTTSVQAHLVRTEPFFHLCKVFGYDC